MVRLINTFSPKFAWNEDTMRAKIRKEKKIFLDVNIFTQFLTKFWRKWKDSFSGFGSFSFSFFRGLGLTFILEKWNFDTKMFLIRFGACNLNRNLQALSFSFVSIYISQLSGIVCTYNSEVLGSNSKHNHLRSNCVLHLSLRKERKLLDSF